ncbi:Helix-turn-helix [uncultured archaeon]|nr:Helix-turn-helix [uncultured archaeon]
MSECEICGRSTDDLYEVRVEGAVMLACGKCARGKDVLHQFSSRERETRAYANARPAQQKEAREEFEIVENYGEIIRSARERLGMPLKVLAEKINETESSLARVERGKSPPGERAMAKLEKELGIKLTVKSEGKKAVPTPKRDEPISMWDAATKKSDAKAGE